MSAFEEGDKDSRICLVGESPAVNEIREGRPFVGNAGALLDRALHAAQIARAQCYIVNVFETQTVKKLNDASKLYSQDGQTLLWTATKGFTDAGREASAGCLAHLNNSAANVTVPLGNTALHLAADVRSISKWRGSIFPGKGVGGRKLVPSIHPSAPLQGQYELRYLLVADLKRAKLESSSPEIIYDKRDLKIDPSFSDCITYLKRALDAPAIDTDIECLNGQVDCFSIALSPSEAISIPIVDAGFEPRWSPDEELEIWRLYAKILAAPHITKINQNIVFDLSFLLQYNHIIPAGPVADPMVAFSVMNPFLSKSLGTICSLYTREPYYKDDGELHDSHNIADFARRWEYNAKDACIALEAWQKLDKELDRDGYRETYDIHMNMASSLIYMTAAGIQVNSAELLKTKIDTEARIAGLVIRMQEAFGRTIITEAPKTAADKRAAAGALNVNSPPQLCEYFYTDKRLRPYVSQEGKPTVDDTALTRIIRRDGLESARLLQEYRGLKKMLSSYLSVQYDHDQRMRCSWNIRGTWLGRLSSSQTISDAGMNLQNLPNEFRGFLVADEVH